MIIMNVNYVLTTHTLIVITLGGAHIILSCQILNKKLIK